MEKPQTIAGDRRVKTKPEASKYSFRKKEKVNRALPRLPNQEDPICFHEHSTTPTEVDKDIYLV